MSRQNGYSPHSEVPDPGSVVLSSGVHELPVLIETNSCHVLGDTFKYIHLHTHTHTHVGDFM